MFSGNETPLIFGLCKSLRRHDGCFTGKMSITLPVSRRFVFFFFFFFFFSFSLFDSRLKSIRLLAYEDFLGVSQDLGITSFLPLSRIMRIRDDAGKPGDDQEGRPAYFFLASAIPWSSGFYSLPSAFREL